MQSTATQGNLCFLSASLIFTKLSNGVCFPEEEVEEEEEKEEEEKEECKISLHYCALAFCKSDEIYPRPLAVF